jgi:hypothetical protein
MSRPVRERRGSPSPKAVHSGAIPRAFGPMSEQREDTDG